MNKKKNILNNSSIPLSLEASHSFGGGWWRLVSLIYLLLILVMAAATVIENVWGTPFVQQNIYGSWWFALMWALLVAVGIVYITKRRMRKWNILLLHASFIIILLGALLTHLTAYQGTLYLRGDQPQNQITEMRSMEETAQRTLPFRVKLDRFELINHAGTSAAQDYITRFSIIDGSRTVRCKVSMNNVCSYRGVRFYQASYDTDNRGSYLSVNSDPWGLPVTYTGYALLFFSLIYMLIDKKGTFRKLLRSPTPSPSPVGRGVLAISLLCPWLPSLLGRGLWVGLLFISLSANAAPTLSPSASSQFGNLYMQYNNRICPVETFALDFVEKLNGHRSYDGMNATEVLAGWIFYGDEWANEPFIRVKSSKMRETFGLEKYARLSDFFRDGEYILGQYAYDYQQGNHDALHKACSDMDDRLMLLMQVRQGQRLTLLPYTFRDGRTVWFSPFEQYPKQLPRENVLFFKNIFPMLYGCMQQGDEAALSSLLDKVKAYQLKNGGASLPTMQQVRAEHALNSVPLATILFIFNLSLGFLSIFFLKRHHAYFWFTGLMTISWAALTVMLILRWVVSGEIPMGNGYETMLTVAWMVMLIAILASLRIHIMTTFGLLMSGFMLLVSHISEMDPAITPRMPVLNSPLLSIHVSIIMLAYALLSITFIISVWEIIKPHSRPIPNRERRQRNSKEIAGSLLTTGEGMGAGLLFLYPAITCLGLGIFIGAIWANISWGNYWSWDPKETWALITLMIYAVPLHRQSIPALQRPRVFHIYMALAFLSILITYFGVNYFLGGMHSYA